MAKKKTTKEVKKVASLPIKEYDVEFLLGKMADYNPRDMTDEERAGLRDSMEKFGYVSGLVYNTKTSTMVGGHQRLKELAAMGYERVQVVTVSLNLMQEKTLNVALNAGTIMGHFTDGINDILAEILNEDPEFYDLANLGSLGVMDEEDIVQKDGLSTENGKEIKEMDLMPYEHYDAVLVVFKKHDNFLFMADKLKLNEKRIISAPMVQNKKLGKVRAVSGDRLVTIINAANGDMNMDFEMDEV